MNHSTCAPIHPRTSTGAVRNSKLILLLAAVFTITVSAGAQQANPSSAAASGSTSNGSLVMRALSDTWGVPEGRTIFPHDWIRGYTDFEIAPKHNEPDLGRCSGAFIGIANPCNDYARYLLSGYLEIQPIGRTLARHAFFFWQPTFSFGRNTPQLDYTWSMAPIAYERSLGLGFELPKHLEFRLTQHQVDWLGRYSNGTLGPADLKTNGPYGLYTTLGVRWYFGGYGRRE